MMKLLILFILLLKCQITKGDDIQQKIVDILSVIATIDGRTTKIEESMKNVETHINKIKNWSVKINNDLESNNEYIEHLNKWKIEVTLSFDVIKNAFFIFFFI